MGKFYSTVNDSFKVFLENPKFIVPKLVMAVFYSVIILLTADLSMLVFEAPGEELLMPALILLVVTFAVGILDIFVGSMYPFMVSQVKKNQALHLRNAAKSAIEKAPLTLPSVLLVEVAFMVLLLIISLPLSFLILSDDAFFLLTMGVYAVVLVAIVFFFYLLYPVMVYEKQSIVGSLKRSIGLSMKNKSGIGKATVISLLLSLLSYALAFSIEIFPQGADEIFFWLAFIIVRVLTAYLYSYLFVLNPVFYLNYVKAAK